MRLDYLLKLGTKELKKNSIENSSLDAELILSNALKYKREKLLCNLDLYLILKREKIDSLWPIYWEKKIFGKQVF